MGLREQMLSVLRNRETQRINFNFTGTTSINISVDGSSFRRVARAIEGNTIHIETSGVAAGWAKYSSRDDARHNTRANTFYIGAGETWSRTFDALLVHESVHASFDLTHSVLPWIETKLSHTWRRVFTCEIRDTAAAILIGSVNIINHIWD